MSYYDPHQVEDVIEAVDNHLAATRNFLVLRIGGNTKAAQVARQRVQKTDARLQSAVDALTVLADEDLELLGRLGE